MILQTTLIVAFASVILWVVIITLKNKNKKSEIQEPIINEPIEQELPIEIDIPGEMPEKPLPINCQLAQFQPAPQDFFYVDCCGVPHKGTGFEPWEKRSPVSIDSNKPFFGMTLLDVEAEINC